MHFVSLAKHSRVNSKKKSAAVFSVLIVWSYHQPITIVLAKVYPCECHIYTFLEHKGSILQVQ